MDLSEWELIDIPETERRVYVLRYKVNNKPPCPDCFTIPASNGVCLCND